MKRIKLMFRASSANEARIIKIYFNSRTHISSTIKLAFAGEEPDKGYLCKLAIEIDYADPSILSYT